MKRLMKFVRTRAAALVVFSALTAAFVPMFHSKADGVSLLQSKYDSSAIIVKFRDESRIQFGGGGFRGANGVMSTAFSRAFAPEKIATRTTLVPGATADDASLNNFYRLKLTNQNAMLDTLKELQSLPEVEYAYPQPIAAPAPTSFWYQDLQNYRRSAPVGIGATDASVLAGGTGTNVKIIDIEYSWNVNHEDLTKAKTALIRNGTPDDPFNDTNHGTAVLGELIADKNTYGVTGATYGAQIGMVNASNVERGYDLVNAIYLATSKLTPGDVLLVEQQAYGPHNGSYVPVEYLPDVYSAIKNATNKGIIVIEAAGNGGENLDNATYYGTTFPNNKADSGAIIVGAGENCPYFYSGYAQIQRTKLYFSNYGKRVNLQGPGNCVTTTGYGGAYNNNTSINAAYTKDFNGTSSASPVVAAAASILSSVWQQQGKSFTPWTIRQQLVSTGTAQPNASSGNIGPLPNVAKALGITNGAPVIAEVGNHSVSKRNIKTIPLNVYDPNNDALSFSLANAPGFMTIVNDAAGPRIVINPAGGNVGYYSNILVSVFDAKNASTVSRPFDVQVLDTTDTTAPMLGQNLKAVVTNAKAVQLTWTAATDNTGVSGYEIYRDGVLYRLNGYSASYVNTAVTVGKTYKYKIRAFDAAGNFSAFSNEVTISVK